MPNIKFLYMRPYGYKEAITSSSSVELVFEICPVVMDYLREHTHCPPYRLGTMLDDNNQYIYRFGCLFGSDVHKPSFPEICRFITQVEQIGNEIDDETFLDRIIHDEVYKIPGLIAEKAGESEEYIMNQIYGFFRGFHDLLLDIWDDDD